MDADALQADGVEHARRRFDDALRRMSFAWLEEQSFGDDRPECGDVDRVGVLEAVAEAAAGGDERIPERECPDRD